ncbi:Beta-hexosaminidase subunit B1 [Leucoagaricus sp. SymC.cos]|nr:Beta-hexosaminidase subunit B1 [Leucoagaricus sp. SymC.cos]
MNRLLFIQILLYLPVALALWPQPGNLTTGNTPIRLSSDFSIKVSGIPRVPKDLSDAVTRTSNFLKTDKLQILVPDRGASLSNTVRSAKTLQSLKISLSSSASGTLKSISEDAIAGLDVADESYTLDVPAGGDATLSANTALGLFRGLTTFEQLWFDLDGTTYTLQAPIQIKDAPVYPYRGLMLDTARN